jgi:integrase
MSTIRDLCARYLRDYPATGGTKRYILERLQRESIGDVVAPGTPQDFIEFCKWGRRTVTRATALLDLTYLSGVLSYAKAGWGLAHVTNAPLREAMPIIKKQGLAGRSSRRSRIPTAAEVAAICRYAREELRNPRLADLFEFQDYSSRRVGETCRLTWGDLNVTSKTILVRDMKHPTHKIGNHRQVALPDEAFEIVVRQPRMSHIPEERIFKFRTGTVKEAFQRICAALGYVDLHLHDFRRGTVTRLLAQGRTVQEVMLVTGQVTVGMVLTTYNGMKAEDFHKRGAA